MRFLYMVAELRNLLTPAFFTAGQRYKKSGLPWEAAFQQECNNLNLTLKCTLASPERPANDDDRRDKRNGISRPFAGDRGATEFAVHVVFAVGHYLLLLHRICL